MSSNGNGDIDRDNEFEIEESSIDWDSEWKKVLNDEGQPVQREPGRAAWNEGDRLKQKVKLATLDATILATKAKKSATSLNASALTSDWKFWVGIIALLSFGSAFIGTMGQEAYTDDSFMV
eukprot:CAMPEP_0113302014 /NCGR_PEP_ID=MMETSP0010_2-20120614/3001_1 /TAXON_ID=216773 ORGANISM="Corethron hystrix, Strain 308" /NCGR_SAMPLE_ID=MMETSP0010_2 /ASSEMBLY_ACC=CAM_ASM_000155 /LENGTH=120 /DNA_ID=CAMNT_0000155729 /DNA_START=274 /DNA_END=636 /DNA_ORIENTATION=+ /assembly_acc=CAM_ASM_000155